MKTSALDFSYPEELIATSRQKVSRVMWVAPESGDGPLTDPQETTISQLISRMEPEDLLVINETRVVKARVFCKSGLEILFIRALEENAWEVLCPSRRWSKDGEILPCGTPVRLLETGLPQIVGVEKTLDAAYFESYGDMPLPPYIQQMRGERASRAIDLEEYQSAWARVRGSLAAPTASLHFNNHDMEKIKSRGIDVVTLCLHVGLGTFLPVHSENLDEHKMHEEWVSIPAATLEKIEATRTAGGRVWALGTTVLRALESWGQGKLSETTDGVDGPTDLFVKPGFKFKVVDVLLTNFHQPKSTLLALVAGFAGLDKVLACYQWAIERKFRLFSYGDLTVWIKK